MAKMPIVIPNNDSIVRNLFTFSELKANEKLSNINLITIIVLLSVDIKPDFGIKVFTKLIFSFQNRYVCTISVCFLIFTRIFYSSVSSSISVFKVLSLK